ncbi:MAG: hypothetical protein KH847_09660, partial [Clostridiales bacterium]|nr:hypothetical protein [Clostridiales bacterium]
AAWRIRRQRSAPQCGRRSRKASNTPSWHTPYSFFANYISPVPPDQIFTNAKDAKILLSEYFTKIFKIPVAFAEFPAYNEITKGRDILPNQGKG